MVEVHDLLRDFESRLILQIHDELLFEIREGEEDLLPKIKETMEKAVELKVPVKVDFGTGKNWAEAHG